MTKCTFCGGQIEPGTGLIYVLKEGSIKNFCSTKCQKNENKLKRKSINTKWTTKFREAKKNE